MEKDSNYYQQLDDTSPDTQEWEEVADFEDDSADESKQLQKNSTKDKGTVRRNIEDFREQQRLKELLGDDLYD